MNMNHPGGRFLLDETDCSGMFLRYFAQLYILLSLYVIEHSSVFCKSKLTHFAYNIFYNLIRFYT